jgi:elongation factor P--(R)-beta-lysine ligase
MNQASPWWDPRVFADRRQFLEKRGRIAAAVRSFFAARGFLEVDTAALQVSPGNETHISAFETVLIAPDEEKSTFYLHTSPEFAAKKLLAAGLPRLFTLAHVFRNRDRSALHHPEFTMLEWYRADEPYEKLLEDCAGLLAAAAKAADRDQVQFRGKAAAITQKPEILTVCEAFERYAGVELPAALGEEADGRAALAAAAGRLGLRVTADDTWSDLFSKILTAKVEPLLGLGRPTLLVDYPAREAALARLKPDRRFAERFELYICGIEIANGFGELTDPREQRRRFEAAMAERQRIYGEAYPIDEDFLAALAIMPQASGIALGFDRLVMLACGAERIEQVIWTPVAAVGTRR